MKFEGSKDFYKTLNCGSPKQAKDLGQLRAEPIRSEWEVVKENIMYQGLKMKFNKPELLRLFFPRARKSLLKTLHMINTGVIDPMGTEKIVWGNC